MGRDAPLYPLSFEPFLRPMPWGGRRLARWIDTPWQEAAPIGEVWLVSDHALHSSRVKNGALTGLGLRELMATRGEELLGRPARRFPLLLKLLDARENLSVQVHPDDAAAVRWAPQEGGKTEAWLVLEADRDATIYLGLATGVGRDALDRALDENTVPHCLQRFNPSPGQYYFVPAGTIHALGGGLVVLEVQETSDATFRLYDWGRVDAAGKARPLHREAGLACLKEQPLGAGLRGEQQVACDFFAMRTCLLEKPLALRGPCIWVGLRGSAAVAARTERTIVSRGGAVLAPACLDNCTIEPHGECQGALIQLNVPSE